MRVRLSCQLLPGRCIGLQACRIHLADADIGVRVSHIQGREFGAVGAGEVDSQLGCVL